MLWCLWWMLLPMACLWLLALQPAAQEAQASGPAGPWGHWALLGDPYLWRLMGRTLLMALATALCCVLLVLPLLSWMRHLQAGAQRVLLLMVMLPCWMPLLVRILAWKSLLQHGGSLSGLLQALGLELPASGLLYNQWAVLLVMVYTQLPFALLPLHAAAREFDPALLEAARDLGASGWQVFWRVWLPGLAQALRAAMLVVMISTLGTYVVSDLVGGVDGELIGNRLVQRALAQRELSQAAVMGVLVMLLSAAGLLLLMRKAGPRSNPELQSPA